MCPLRMNEAGRQQRAGRPAFRQRTQPEADRHQTLPADREEDAGLRLTGFYFEVSPTEGVSDAMQALVRKIVLAPRITS